MIIIAHADLNIYQKTNVCAKNSESKNLDGVIVVFIANTRSDILIRIFEGELGREKHLTDIDEIEFKVYPNKGELIALESNEENDDYTVWEVINMLHDYTINEMNIFVKRYIWPDER